MVLSIFNDIVQLLYQENADCLNDVKYFCHYQKNIIREVFHKIIT